MTRFMQLMLDGKPVALPEDEYHMAVSRAQAQARQLQSKPQRAPEPQGSDSDDEPPAWRSN